MKTKVKTLRDNIKNNIDYLIREYSTADDILYQLNLMLDMKMTDDKINEWFNLNRYTIDNINELLEEQSS